VKRLRTLSLDEFVSAPGTEPEDFRKFSCKELHAISMGIRLAEMLDFFGKGASGRSPAVTIARLEGQITVKKVREKDLTQDELCELVMMAIFHLVQRTNKAQNKPVISLDQFLRSFERHEGYE
jgi:hypothetical protein